MIRAERTELFPVLREVLWEQLSNTERLNRKLNLPEVHYTFEPRVEGGAFVKGSARFGPTTIPFREEPYRWLRPAQWWVQRIPESGPVSVYRVGVVLQEVEQGTRVTAWAEAEPRGVLGRALARRIVESSVNGILRACADNPGPEVIPTLLPGMPPPPGIKHTTVREALAVWWGRLEGVGISPALAGRLLGYLLTAPPEEVIHFRPFALAALWQEERREILRLCLRAVRAGALELHWRLLCPACRGAGPSVESLAALTPDKAHCLACNIEFGPAFDRDVEVCFSVAPALRQARSGAATYCLAGPHRSRHLVFQWYLAPAESAEILWTLPAGRYRLRSPQVPETQDITLPWAAPQVFGEHVTLSARGLENHASYPVLVRLESLDWREEAATAAEVTALAEFRQHFGSEVLAPGMELDVRQLTILFTDLKGSTQMYAQRGDAPSFALVREHFSQLTGLMEQHDGSVVKTIGDAVMAVFPTPSDAIQSALAIQSLPGPLVIKIGLHSGPALAVGANGTLDYFGHTVNVAARIQQESQGGDIVLADALAQQHAALLTEVLQETFTATLRGTREEILLRRLRTDLC